MCRDVNHLLYIRRWFILVYDSSYFSVRFWPLLFSHSRNRISSKNRHVASARLHVIGRGVLRGYFHSRCLPSFLSVLDAALENVTVSYHFIR